MGINKIELYYLYNCGIWIKYINYNRKRDRMVGANYAKTLGWYQRKIKLDALARKDYIGHGLRKAKKIPLTLEPTSYLFFFLFY